MRSDTYNQKCRILEKNRETIDQFIICNEILLLQIRIHWAPRGQFYSVMSKNIYTIISKNAGVFLIFFLTYDYLIALPVLVQSIVNANSNGATTGSFERPFNTILR